MLKDSGGKLPLHSLMNGAIDGEETAQRFLAVIRYMIDRCRQVCISTDVQKRTPMLILLSQFRNSPHIKIAKETQLQALQILLSAHPRAAQMQSSVGKYPLHEFLQQRTSSASGHAAKLQELYLARAVKILLDAWPPAARVAHTSIGLPLHLAVELRLPTNVCSTLLSFYPDSLDRNRSGDLRQFSENTAEDTAVHMACKVPPGHLYWSKRNWADPLILEFILSQDPT
eukprot:SAG31_NODE_9980_length_1201_cov_1.681488_1_plen_227_part_10